jgi:hypothetical protein
MCNVNFVLRKDSFRPDISESGRQRNRETYVSHNYMPQFGVKYSINPPVSGLAPSLGFGEPTHYLMESGYGSNRSATFAVIPS